MGLFRYSPKSFAREILMVAVAVIWCVPAYVLVALSLKPADQIYTNPVGFPDDAKFSDYSQAWREGGQDGLGHSLYGSALITIVSVLGLIVFGSLCAYAIARRPSKFSGAMYGLFVLGIILPFQLAIIPVFAVMRELGLTGSYWGMILLHIGLHMPLVVFIYTGFLRALPKDYEEAARIDGAGLLRMWTRVVFPLMLPVTGTVAILAGLTIWNDFFLSLVYLFGSSKDVLPTALYSFVGEYTAQWQLIMATIAISIAPIFIVYLFGQRQLIRGFAGGIKGG